MNSRSFMISLLVIIISFSRASSRLDLGALGLGGSSGLGGLLSPSMTCMTKLMPCKPYLKPSFSESTPPASCCGPLKEIITTDSKCLCNVFNNPDTLKSLNVTQEEALKLPEACGANADISNCKTEVATPTSSPTILSALPPISSSSFFPSDAKSTDQKKDNASSMSSGFGKTALVGLFCFVIVLAI